MGRGGACLRELLVRDDARLAQKIARMRCEVSGGGGLVLGVGGLGFGF